MGSGESQPQPSVPDLEFKELESALSCQSTYEIPFYLTAFQIDVNRPTSFSPMHYIVEKTYRLNILQFLIETCKGDPTLRYNSHTLLTLAMSVQKLFYVKYLMKLPMPTESEKESLVGRQAIFHFFKDEEARNEALGVWDSRIRMGKRLFFISVSSRRGSKPLQRLNKNLIKEIAQYI